MITVVNFIHMLAGTLFFGATVAVFIYMIYCKRQNNGLLLLHTIKISFFGDAFILPMIITQYITGTLMIGFAKLSFHTPWIAVAYVAFSLIVFLWMCNLFVKRKLLHLLSSEKGSILLWQRIYLIISCMMIVLFVMIVHDAVMQKTMFDFFWR